MSAPSPRDLLVVGAGLSGLAAAWRAKAAGKSVVVLEAFPRAGGVVRTDRVGPYRVERGAASFPSTAEHLVALAAACPNPPAVREAPADAARQFLLSRRGLVEVVRSPSRFVLSGVLSPWAAARTFAEALRGPRRSTSPESAHEFARRRFGTAFADGLLRPMTLGVYGADPRDLGAADAFPTLALMEREHGSVLRALARRGAPERRAMTFEGGMESLPRALADALGPDLRLSTPVERLGADGDGVAVTTRGGDVVRAGRAVLAVPAQEQARLVTALSPAAAEILGAVRYVPMVVAAVGIPPGGAPAVVPMFGFLRGPGSRARILGASFPSVLDASCAPDGHTLLSVFLGGSADPGALDLDDDALRSVVERDLAVALGGPVRPDLFSVHRWPRAIPVLSPGHRSRMSAAQGLVNPSIGAAAKLTDSPRLLLSGSHVTGVSLESCVAPPPS